MVLGLTWVPEPASREAQPFLVASLNVERPAPEGHVLVLVLSTFTGALSVCMISLGRRVTMLGSFVAKLFQVPCFPSCKLERSAPKAARVGHVLHGVSPVTVQLNLYCKYSGESLSCQLFLLYLYCFPAQVSCQDERLKLWTDISKCLSYLVRKASGIPLSCSTRPHRRSSIGRV